MAHRPSVKVTASSNISDLLVSDNNEPDTVSTKSVIPLLYIPPMYRSPKYPLNVIRPEIQRNSLSQIHNTEPINMPKVIKRPFENSNKFNYSAFLKANGKFVI